MPNSGGGGGGRGEEERARRRSRSDQSQLEGGGGDGDEIRVRSQTDVETYVEESIKPTFAKHNTSLKNSWRQKLIENNEGLAEGIQKKLVWSKFGVRKRFSGFRHNAGHRIIMITGEWVQESAVVETPGLCCVVPEMGLLETEGGLGGTVPNVFVRPQTVGQIDIQEHGTAQLPRFSGSCKNYAAHFQDTFADESVELGDDVICGRRKAKNDVSIRLI